MKNDGYPRRDECSHTKYAYWLSQHIVIPSQVSHLHIYYIIKLLIIPHFLFIKFFNVNLTNIFNSYITIFINFTL